MSGLTSGSWKKGHRSMHDLRAASRKGKANSPWRYGCNWLSGGGNSEQRVALANKRERLVRKLYPGALKRWAVVVE